MEKKCEYLLMKMDIYKSIQIRRLKMLKPVVDLSSIDGKAFMIIGAATKALRKAGFNKKLISKYTKEATSGDYDHLIQITMEYCEVI